MKYEIVITMSKYFSEHVKILSGHTDWVVSVAYSPDGRHIVSGSRDSTIRIWDNPVVVYQSYLKPYLITNLIGVVMKYI